MKKITLKEILVFAAAFVGLLVFCLSFAVNLKGTMVESDNVIKMTFKGAIWGCKEIKGELNGRVEVASSYELFGLSSTGLNLFGFFGVLLPLLAAIGAVVVLFAVKNEKVRMYILLGLAFLFVLGGIFQFLLVPGEKACALHQFMKEHPDYAPYKAEVKTYIEQIFIAYNIKLGALSILSGIFTILSGGALVASQLVKTNK